MNISRRNALLIGILIILLIVAGYYFLFLNPLLNNLGEAEQERMQKEEQLAQLEGQVQELEQVRSNAPEIERRLLELSKRLPEQPEIPTLVVQIEEIAASSEVTQLSIQPEDPQPPPEGGDFSRIPVTMTFEGTYSQMQNFLLRLQNLVRLVTVNGVTYEAAEPGEGEQTGVADDGLLEVEVRAETYFQSSEPLPGEESPAITEEDEEVEEPGEAQEETNAG